MVYNSQIEIDRDPRMRKLTIMGQAIFFMNENESYPSPDINASESFCVWFDEEGQYWLDVFRDREWRRAFPGPLKDMEEVIMTVQGYDL